MTSALLLPALAAFGVGYLLGSIPFGLLLTKAAGLGDVRQIGSGNIGATNVLRTGNKKVAVATLFLDGFKGFVAVVLVGSLASQFLFPATAGRLPPADAAAIAAAHVRFASIWQVMMAAGLGAFLGHLYPVWLGFKGGKGMATFIGVLFGLAWIIALICCAVWLVVAAVFRYSSLASLTAAATTPIAIFWLGSAQLAFLFALMAILLFWKHRENIERLLTGTESRIGAKSAKPEAGSA